MPGKIQVSVLDLLDFPSSSSSTISIKVSMGKREFQTWDKGDFSFPLTSLRENIVVTIHDTEGKVLSRTGVETILVIEKGTWDEFFVLEGGGRLHMKLQFILSNVERKRIQELREIALKKKQEELLINRTRHSETASLASFHSNVGSSSASLNHEVTDSSESLVQMEAESSRAEFLRNADDRSKKALSSSSNEDGVLAAQLAHPDPKSVSIRKNPLPTPSSRIKDSIPGIGNSQEIFLDQLEEPIRSDVDVKGGALSTVILTEDPQIHHAKAEKQVVDKIKNQVPPLDVSTSSGEGNLSTDVLSEELHIRHTKVGEKVIDKIETPLSSVDIPSNSSEGMVLLSEELQIPYGKPHEKVIDKNETRIPPDTPKEAISSLEALDTVSDTNEVCLNLNESKTMSPPADIPARPISSLEEVDSRSPEHSVSSKFEEDRTLNENKTLGSPSDPGNYTISTKSEEERSINKNETLIPPTNISVRRISSLKDLGNHSNSSKFGEVQMLNKSKLLVPPTDVPMRRISSHENFDDHSRTSKSEEDRVVIPDKPNVMKRTPSNVRKMISAFETSQAKGQAIRADPPIIRTQPIKSKFNIYPAEPTVKEVMKESNRTLEFEETGLSSSSIGISQEVHLQRSLNYSGKSKYAGLEQNGKQAVHEHETFKEESKETGRAIRRTETDAETRSNLSSIVKTRERFLQESVSDKLCVQHIEKPTKETEDYRAKKYLFGSSGSFILTDESRPFCITTGSKQFMNLVGGSSNCSETDLGEKSSYQTDVTNEQNLHHNTRNEVWKIGKASGDTLKPNLEGLPNVFEGLIGQAAKIAAIAAFGALVIFARER